MSKPEDIYNETIEEVMQCEATPNIFAQNPPTKERKHVSELTYSEAGYRFTKAYESLHDGDLSSIGLQPKLCPAGVWTRGYGEAIVVNGKFLTAKDHPVLDDYIRSFSLTDETEADLGMRRIMVRYENWLKNRITVPLLQREFDALVDHTYNTGGSNGLVKLINERATDTHIYNWFTQKYITANGRILKGLVYRRVDNAETYFKGDYNRDYKTQISI